MANTFIDTARILVQLWELAATARWPFTERNTWRPAVPTGATAAGGAM